MKVLPLEVSFESSVLGLDEDLLMSTKVLLLNPSTQPLGRPLLPKDSNQEALQSSL